MTERINSDFIKAYTELDRALLADYGGITGYLLKAGTVRRFEKEGHPDFDSDTETLKKENALYTCLTETQNVKAPIASEDDIDYLRDFLNRFYEERDPLAQIQKAPDQNNADAKKYLPIETEAREVSRKVIHRKKRIAIASVAAAIATVTLTLLIRHKRGNKV